VLGLIKEYKPLSNRVKNEKLKSQIRNHMHLCLSRIISVYPYLTIRNSIFVIRYSIFKKYLGMLLGLFLVLFGFTNAYSAYAQQNQIITPEPSSISVGPGSEFSFSVKYDVSDGNNMLTGIGIRLHYDSSILEYVETNNVFDEDHLAGAISCEDDTENWDDDDNTDKFVLACWFDLGGKWPNEDLPLILFKIKFKVKDEIVPPVDTSINFTASSTASEYGFESTPVTVKIEESGANNAPVAQGKSVETSKNKPIDIMLEATDPDGDPLTYIITSLPSNGSLKEGDTEITSVPYSLSGDTVTYTPNTDYTGSDSFKFKANDGKEDSNEATVSITVMEAVGFQSIIPEPISIDAGPGDEFTFSIKYDASSNALMGIGFYIHYSSNFLDFIEVSNVFEKGFMGLVGPEDDIDDKDNNPITDKRFLVSWIDPELSLSWPDSKLPLNLLDITFHIKEWIIPPFELPINFTKKFCSEGCCFQSMFMKLHVVSFHLDIDGDGKVKPLTDGLLLIRHLFGLSGNNLVKGAVSSDGFRTEPDRIAYWIDKGIGNLLLDIDDDGIVMPLSDGLLAVRYLFGFRDDDLVMGAINNPDGKRTDPEEIVDYIERYLMPF